MMAGVTGNEKTEISTLSEKILPHYNDSDCRATFVSIEKLNTRFNFDNSEVLVQVSPFQGASQQSLRTTLHARFLHLRHYFS